MPGAQNELQQTVRPDFELGSAALRVVDLFAGCGGLTLGLAQAAQDLGLALDIPLAVDHESSAADVYRDNFPNAKVETASVETYFDGALNQGNTRSGSLATARLTRTERATRERCGRVDFLVGGPPCQGHSDLNNHTRRDDPKNALYARMARAAKVLRPAVILIENVPAVRHDIGNVVGLTEQYLGALGYEVAARTIAIHSLGVAQTRKRHLLLGIARADADPRSVLDDLSNRQPGGDCDLRWAIGDLHGLKDRVGWDTVPRASATNLGRMQHLLDEDKYDLPNERRPKCHQDGSHSYKSMYGRLRWTQPAQTVTSGFSSIGQGRYMHPAEARALTAHEAARIQGFPDYFTFDRVIRKTELANMIGNAVPPAVARSVLLKLVASNQLDLRATTEK